MLIAGLLAVGCLAAKAGKLHSAVVPHYKPSEQTLYFSFLATLINDSDELARNCRLDLVTDLPLNLTFWSTNQDNDRVGEDYRRVDIEPRQAQTFGFSIRAYKALDTDALVQFPLFECDNLPPAQQIAGVNSVDLSSARLRGLEWLGSKILSAWGYEAAEPMVQHPIKHNPYSRIMLPKYLVEQQPKKTPQNIAELNLEQAAWISQLKPTRWNLYNEGAYTAVQLMGNNLGNLDITELTTNPQSEVRRYLSALRALTKVDTSMAFEIEGLDYRPLIRNPSVAFRQVVGDTPTDFRSRIHFTKEGVVTRVSTSTVQTNLLPELVIDAHEALRRAKSAVKAKYGLLFVYQVGTNRDNVRGTFDKTFRFSSEHNRVVVEWSITFIDVITGLHRVIVDGTTGEARVRQPSIFH